MSSDSLDIIPFRNNAKINVEIPGSKSISNRALILSVLNYGKVNLKGILESDDVNIMIVALMKLGVKIERENKNRRGVFRNHRKFSNRLTKKTLWNSWLPIGRIHKIKNERADKASNYSGGRILKSGSRKLL